MTTRPYTDRVIAGHIRFRPDGRVYWPLISTCLVCEGVGTTGSYDPEGATRIALMQHGYSLAKWEGIHVLNAFIVPRPCQCGHMHNWQDVLDALVNPVTQLIHCTECSTIRGKPDSSD